MLALEQLLLEVFFEDLESSAQYKIMFPKDDILRILSGFGYVFP